MPKSSSLIIASAPSPSNAMPSVLPTISRCSAVSKRSVFFTATISDRRQVGLLKRRRRRRVVPADARDVGRAGNFDLVELGGLLGALQHDQPVEADRHQLADARIALLARRIAAEALRIVERVNVFADDRHGRALKLEQARVAGLLERRGVRIGQRVLHDEIEKMSRRARSRCLRCRGCPGAWR